MEMRMDSADVHVPTEPTVSAMREESNVPTKKTKKNARVKENKQVMKNIATATKVKESHGSKKEDEDNSTWLLKLSNAEQRKTHVPDSCIGQSSS